MDIKHTESLPTVTSEAGTSSALSIIFIARSLAVGGAERQLILTSRTLAERGHDVTLIVLSKKLDLARGVDLSHVNFICIEKKSRWDFGSWMPTVIKHLKAAPKAVVFGWQPSEALMTFFISCVFSPHPWVWSVRASNINLSEYDWLTAVVYRLHRWLVRRRKTDCVVFNSYAGAAAYGIAEDKKRCHVIWNAVDGTVFQPSQALREAGRTQLSMAPSVPLIGIFGRLVPFKDHSTFLRAMRRIHLQRPDIRFVMVGGGSADYEGLLQRKISELELDGVVRMTGESQAMPALYNAVDVVVSTSKDGEGVQNTIMEAMSCGRPVVATSAGDVSRYLSELDRIVAPGDDAAVADAALSMLITDTAQMRTARSQYAQRTFNAARLADEFETVARCSLRAAS